MSWDFISKHRHYGTRVYLSALAVGAAVKWIPVSSTVGWFTDLVPLLVLPVGALYSQSHSKHLCEQCFASMSVNASEEAESRRPLLRLDHSISDSEYRAPALGITLLVCLVASHLVGYPADAAILTVNSAVLGGWVWVSMIHSRYQPWCPWCDEHGGDDDREDVPTPEQPQLV